MDYKNKYEQALERARKLATDLPNGRNDRLYHVWDLESIFPELKESEDERIRKRIIHALHGDVLEMSEIKEAVAWLEKQGEHKQFNDNFPSFDEAQGTVIIEKQCEQKIANKAEPKFKVGDKIQYLKGCGMPFLIEKIENGEYIFGNNMGHTTIESGNKWHLVDTVEQNLAWSEEDKLIISVINSLINMAETETGQWYYNGSKKVFYSDIRQWLKSLKNRVQLKQEWSEEDEVVRNDIIAKLTLLKSRAVDGGSEKEICAEEIGWLKSLRPQLQWKPSNEQMEALDRAQAELCSTEYNKSICDLIDSLNKLREE